MRFLRSARPLLPLQFGQESSSKEPRQQLELLYSAMDAARPGAAEVGNPSTPGKDGKPELMIGTIIAIPRLE